MVASATTGKYLYIPCNGRTKVRAWASRTVDRFNIDLGLDKKGQQLNWDYFLFRKYKMRQRIRMYKKFKDFWITQLIVRYMYFTRLKSVTAPK